MPREIIATRADGVEVTYPSIRDALAALGLHPPSIHRALRHRNPLNKGPLRGWKFRYADTPMSDLVEPPEDTPEPGPYAGYPTSRYEALQRGAAHYYTGKPCKRGHLALRKTRGACLECLRLSWDAAKEVRKPYFEAYRNKPEVKARARAYYQEHKPVIHRPEPAPEPVEVPAVEVSPPPKPTYKELMEQARVKPRV